MMDPVWGALTFVGGVALIVGIVVLLDWRARGKELQSRQRPRT